MKVLHKSSTFIFYGLCKKLIFKLRRMYSIILYYMTMKTDGIYFFDMI